MIKAFCFDMDGVLFDTESTAGVMLNAATQRQGITLTDTQWTQMLSKSLTVINGLLTEWFGDSIDLPRFAQDWYEVTLDYMREKGMPVKPGAEELLRSLKAKGYKLAICTSNMSYVVRDYLMLAGWTDIFDEIVTNEMISCGKPDPEVYLTGAARLGVEPHECIGIEDSYSGVKAVRAAGMYCVMVPDVFPYTEELAPYVDLCLNSLEEFENAIFNKE